MARVTVEDCLPNVENLFQLVLLASARARRLANGAEPTVPVDNDKVTVIALREIAEGNITPEMLVEPEPIPEPVVTDIDAQFENFRAPQFGLVGEYSLASMDASSLLGLIPGTSARRTPGLKELLAKVEVYLPPEQVERIRDATEFGAAAHQGQKRLSGEPYIAHPLAAAQLLADLHLDADTIIGAILHDVIEDTPVAKDEIERRFGKDVAEIVDGVTKLDQIQFKSREEAQAESFRKMLLAMVRDLRVIMVKLADRTHNMRTIGAMSVPRRRQIARETLDIYAPVAERLGLYKIKLELEDLGFRALYPQRYRVIERALKKARGNQREFLGKIEAVLRDALQRAGIRGEVESREKHLYSVYRKMRRKRSMLAQVVDVYGLRILVESADTCYRALGVVHSSYRPMPGRFKDYIAIPRVNGYQSLHTTLFGPNGVPIEVQIRTYEMHTVAEAGVASHWKYKVNAKSGEGNETVQQERARAWINHLMEMQASGNAEEFIESVKVDLFPDKVYVFTPKGAILRLPRGATVVDFAYAVHTDIGNRCVAAKVDRRLAPLRTVLRNGQTVQIITAKGASPNPAWVNFVATAKARSAIRHYLKALQRSEAVELGAQLLNSALEEFQTSVDRIAPAVMAQTLQEFNIRDREELLTQIGLGERLAPLVARRLLPGGHDEKGKITPLTVAGTEGLLVTYARCCRPIPDDPIIAYLSAGRGIVIHRDACGNVEDFQKHPEKWQPVTWQKDLNRFFSAEVRIEALNKIGLLASVSAAIAATATNIGQASVESRDGDVSLIKLEVEVKDRKHLARVVRTIRQMPNVLRVSRYLASRRSDPE